MSQSLVCTVLFISQLVTISLAAVSAYEPPPLDSNISKNIVNYRLPNTTHPVSYDISIVSRVDENSFDFSGSVNIEIVVDEATREIVLHARQLTIVNITLRRYGGQSLFELMLNPFEYDVVTEFLTIRANRSILNEGDRLQLQINYVGQLRNDRGGFYRSSYMDRFHVTK